MGAIDGMELCSRFSRSACPRRLRRLSRAARAVRMRPVPDRPAELPGRRPYQVNGVWYPPRSTTAMTRPARPRGTARVSTARRPPTARSTIMNQMTAAHKTLPLPSVVEVTNLQNGRARPLAGQRPRSLCRRPADRRVAPRRADARVYRPARPGPGVGSCGKRVSRSPRQRCAAISDGSGRPRVPRVADAARRRRPTATGPDLRPRRIRVAKSGPPASPRAGSDHRRSPPPRAVVPARTSTGI